MRYGQPVRFGVFLIPQAANAEHKVREAIGQDA
jgi:hypothetical protein